MFLNDDAHKRMSMFSAMNHKDAFSYLNTGADFRKWKEKTLFMLEIMDLHIALFEEAPRVSIENSVEEKEKYELKAAEWEKSNNVSLIILKHVTSSEIKNKILDSVYAKEYLSSIEKYFADALPVENGL